MRRPRIVRITHSAVVAEYREREYLLRERYGYDVHVISPAAFLEGGTVVRAAEDARLPVHVVPTRGVPNHPILFWYASRQVRNLLRQLQPDIVDLHEEPYSLAAAAALSAVKRAAPAAQICIYTAQNILKRYPLPFRQLQVRALRASAAAYPCSQEAADVLRTNGFRGAVHVLPLGVAVPQSTPARDAGDPLRVGFVGRLEPYKGPHLALRAFAAAASDTRATMEILGSGSQAEPLTALVAQLGLSGRVTLPGAVSQSEALRRIAGYDVILVPSQSTGRWKEQFGRVAVQALAAGTPVVAFASGALGEVLGDAAMLVEEGDSEGLARGLRRLLSDAELRQRLSRAGVRRALTTFSWDAVAAGVDDMYGQLVRATRP